MDPFRYLLASSGILPNVLDTENFTITKRMFGRFYEVFAKKLYDMLEFFHKVEVFDKLVNGIETEQKFSSRKLKHHRR